MSDTSKLEQVVWHIVNEQPDQAEQLLHEVFVSKAQQIYEQMQTSEGTKIQPMDTKFITEVGPVTAFIAGGALGGLGLSLLLRILIMLLFWIKNIVNSVSDNRILIKIVNEIRRQNNLSELSRLTSEDLKQTIKTLKDAERFGLANKDAARAFAIQAIQKLVNAINEICETFGFEKVTISLVNKNEPKLVTETRIYRVDQSFEVLVEQIK
jgi:hypothetical protein